jgi:molybdenum cofactor cytidylyltransferase
MRGKTAAILLAAGLSRRMGSCKQLLPLGEESVLARCLRTLLAAGIDQLIVVVSPEGNAVAAEAERFPVRVVVNREPGGDMASSIRTGRDALPDDLGRVVIALCDHPLVLPATVVEMIRISHSHPESIIIPCHAGRRGHPVLLPKKILQELHTGMTLRDVIRTDPNRIVEIPVDDEGAVLDMDTPEDYRVACLVSAQRVSPD